MKNAFEYEDQLAALREELAEWKARAGRRTNDMGEISSEKLELKQRLADAERRNESLRVLLRSASIDYACCLESGYDRITQLGGDCDSVEKMLADNPNYARYIAAFNPNPEAASQ